MCWHSPAAGKSLGSAAGSCLFCTSSPLLPLRVCALACCEVQRAVLCSSPRQCQPWGAGVPPLSGTSWAEQKVAAASKQATESLCIGWAGQAEPLPPPR